MPHTALLVFTYQRGPMRYVIQFVAIALFMIGCSDEEIRVNSPCDEGYEYDESNHTCHTQWDFVVESSGYQPCSSAEFGAIALPYQMNEFRSIGTSSMGPEAGSYIRIYDEYGYEIEAIHETFFCTQLLEAQTGDTIWPESEIRHTVFDCDDHTYPGPVAHTIRWCGDYSIAIEGRHVMLPIVE